MMELTKERLQEIAEDGFLKHGEAKEMASQLLAGMEQGPVAFIARYESGAIHGTCDRDDPVKMESLKRGMAVSPLYAAPQLPQPAVPDEWRMMCGEWRDDTVSIHDDSGLIVSGMSPSAAGIIIEAHNSFRAAMLQGDEPVTTAYKLPANTPCKEAPEHIWLQTDGVWPENGEFSELTWCSDNQHPDDTLYVRADIVAGNSPVIPDDVRRMDWLVSKTVDVREPMVYGSHSLFWSQTITDEEDDYHATKLREQIDAAMAAENAAAPQQEVK